MRVSFNCPSRGSLGRYYATVDWPYFLRQPVVGDSISAIFREKEVRLIEVTGDLPVPEEGWFQIHGDVITVAFVRQDLDESGQDSEPSWSIVVTLK